MVGGTEQLLIRSLNELVGGGKSKVGAMPNLADGLVKLVYWACKGKSLAHIWVPLPMILKDGQAI